MAQTDFPARGLAPRKRLRHAGAWTAALVAAAAIVSCGGADAPAPAPTSESPASAVAPAAAEATATPESAAAAETAASVGLQGITSYAGSGSPKFGGDGGPANGAGIYSPTAVATDKDGNLYIYTDKRIRRVDAATGIITTFAGRGSSLSLGDDGPALKAGFREVLGMEVDSAGNLIIADHGFNIVRRVDAATGIITTVAGGGTAILDIKLDVGDGGPATSAIVIEPMEVAVDRDNNIYIVSNHRIRKVDIITGVISTITGDGSRDLAGDGGPAVDARIAEPEGIAIDAAGNVFIADTDNHRVRMVDAATGVITTVAGQGKFQDRKEGNVAFDVRREGTGAGYSGDGGPGTDAKLRLPNSLAIDSDGNLFIVEAGNRVRKLDAAGIITTYVAGETESITESGKVSIRSLTIGQISGIALNSEGVIFLADMSKNVVHRIPAASAVSAP